MKSLMENDNVAAVMLECVQGEGGVFPLEKEFLQRVADYAKQRDILVIIDEVQSGNGRSGALYSYMNYGIQPDLVTTAKGLGGGLPIGACLFGDKVETIFQKGDNGSTFGGNLYAVREQLIFFRVLPKSCLSKFKKSQTLSLIAYPM